MNIPWIESPFFDQILQQKNLSIENKLLATEYHKNGFVVLKSFLDNDLLDNLRNDMDKKGFNPNFKMKNQRDDVRITDFWMHSQSAKSVASNEKILDILKMFYEKEPIPFQTLNFKVGTQQRAHSDTIHFSSIPARFMCGVWVALEDITPENGAVFYYPTSQKLQEYNFSHFKNEPSYTSYDDYIEYENFIEKMLDISNFEKKHFYAKKGDVLIWSSNLIHGGSEVLNKQSSRYSQVTHYFFEDCFYYTPMLSNMVTNELFLRNKITNITTNKKVQQTFNGHNIKTTEISRKLYSLSNKKQFNVIPELLRKLLFKIQK